MPFSQTDALFPGCYSPILSKVKAPLWVEHGLDTSLLFALSAAMSNYPPKRLLPVCFFLFYRARSRILQPTK
ncbi:MAG: hypothetical protein WA453_02370, partial [Methyloceanibacter sp.]